MALHGLWSNHSCLLLTDLLLQQREKRAIRPCLLCRGPGCHAHFYSRSSSAWCITVHHAFYQPDSSLSRQVSGQEEVPHATISTGTLLFSSAISFVAIIFRSIKPCVWSRNLREGSCEEAACVCLCCIHVVVLILSFVTLISALWFHLCV